MGVLLRLASVFLFMFLLSGLVRDDGSLGDWVLVVFVALLIGFGFPLLRVLQQKYGLDIEPKKVAPVKKNNQESFAGRRKTVRNYCPPVQDELIPDFIIADVETTGFNPERDFIAQIGAIRVRDGVVVGEYAEYIRIPVSMPPDAARVNGITDSLLRARGISERLALAGFVEFCGDLPVVAYNADFDYSFIATACHHYGLALRGDFYCALRLARSLWDFPSYKLASVSRALGVDKEQRHEALSDCRLTLDVLLAANNLFLEKKRAAAEKEAELAKLSGPLPFDSPMPVVLFDGGVFTFHGEMKGDVNGYIDAIGRLGGSHSKNVTLKVNYLVLGELISLAWRYGPFVKQIDKAIKYRDERSIGLAIISEGHFARCLKIASLPAIEESRQLLSQQS